MNYNLFPFFFIVTFVSVFDCTAQNANDLPYGDNYNKQVVEKLEINNQSNDLSYNLDLQAVASVLGEVRNLEEFERRLNDSDNQISNLDLNNDGQIDYLRVIDRHDNGAHLIVIQSVLSRDTYQDVATIVIERREDDRFFVQVIGDPYLYGHNYIIEPEYTNTPQIFAYLWGNLYSHWSSPFYWGYYPSYYHVRNPLTVVAYLANVHPMINHNHRYYYSDRVRFSDYDERRSTISRNDYGNLHTEHAFENRVPNTVNKQSFSSHQFYPGTTNFHQPEFRNNYDSGREHEGSRQFEDHDARRGDEHREGENRR